jgi:hypothetical protein
VGIRTSVNEDCFFYARLYRGIALFRQPISVYLIYAQKDEVLKQEFEDYLTIMRQNGLISSWVERQVQRGTEVKLGGI